MKRKYIPAVVMLTAGAVTGIMNIINKVDTVSGLKRLLFVLLIFYIVGVIARKVINRTLTEKKKTEEKEAESKENTEEDVERQPKDKE